MSEQQEERPLTRREMRERRLGVSSTSPETGSLDTGTFGVPAQEQPVTPHVPFAAPAEDNFEETSPHMTESGRSLSRREMRELWLAEQAKRDVAQQPAAPPAAVPEEHAPRVASPDPHYAAPVAEPIFPQPTAEPTNGPVAHPAPVVPVAVEPVAPAAAYTQEQVSLQDFFAAPTVGQAAVAPQPAPVAEPVYVQPEPVVIEPPMAQDIVAEDIVAEDIFVQQVAIPPVPDNHVSQAQAQAQDAGFLQPEAHQPAFEAEFVTEAIPVDMPRASESLTVEPLTVEVEPLPDVPAATPSYQFPSIAPEQMGENIGEQVTADPSTVTFNTSDLLTDLPATPVHEVAPTASDLPPAEGSGGGDFDDIISRAVADEGVETSSGALILPVIPDSSDLSGALNETGEVYITGSIELPRALGETGGHSRLHDSVDNLDNVLGDMESDELAPDDTRPVAATRAISAQASGNAIVTPTTKSGSRLPLILSVTAGGFVLLVGGLIAWVVTNGLG